MSSSANRMYSFPFFSPLLDSKGYKFRYGHWRIGWKRVQNLCWILHRRKDTRWPINHL